MSRAPKNFRSVRLLSLLTVAALCLVPSLTARAASYVYGSRQRTVNAGVLISGKASTLLSAAPDPSPYVFYLFNLRTDVKPFGWNVVNPQAPSVVTAATASRWTTYSVGQSVSQDMAAYWEVPLSDTSADQLRQYDVLYLPLGGVIGPADNEKLRRFVDGGGQLWVEGDPHGGAAPFTSGGFASFFDVSIASGTPIGPALPPSGPAFLRHPILSQPFLMSYDDLFGMGVSPGYVLTDNSAIFGDALLAGSSRSVAVSQYGSGQVIASALDVGGAINDFAGDAATTGSTFRYNNGPYCGSPGNSHALSTPNGFINTAAAPTADLRFLANLIALAGTHPNENKTGRQNASSNDLASFAPAWTYALTNPPTSVPNPPTPQTVGTATPPGAAVWGNYVYVTTYGLDSGGKASGILHAFDAYPAEFLTAVGQADDGLADFGASPPTAYDEVWNANVGPNASAPTVASSGGSTSVFVERADGSVVSYDAVTGKPGTPLTTGAQVTLGASAYPVQDTNSNTLVANAPAPVVSNGKIYAGQPNSDLLVGPAAGGTGDRVPLVPTATTEAVAASPSVGVLADGSLTNDLVAIVPTTQNLYTVFLGARADLLQPIPANTTPPTGYNVNRGRLRLYNLKLQATGQAYTFTGNNVTTTVNTAGSPDFLGSQSGAVYGDYDALLDPATASTSSFQNGQTLNLNEISDFSYGAVSGGTLPTGAVVSAPATDRNGDLYYTVTAAGNSYLFGVHQDPQFQNVRVKFRFRLPRPGELVTDGDGVDYSTLAGYQFVGAPIVDNQGLIYVAAQSGSNAAVLCFSTTQPIYADASGSFDPSQATYTQPDEFNSTQPNQLRPGPVDGTLRYGQFSAVGNRVTFYNFGIGTGAIRQIAGNLTEPQPVLATPNPDPNQAQQNLNAVTLPLHTNLVWFVRPFSVNGSISGLTKVGDTLYFSDSGTITPLVPSVLYSVNANGGSDGTPITNKQIAYNALNSAKRAMVAPAATLGLGATTATPSVGGQVLVVSGVNGVAALTQQLTLVTDNNRILEVDTSGNAIWGVDATARVAQGGTTYVDFSHPASLSQVTPNDYLVADTGNNRCVRFDRAGDVIWELTHFTDPVGLLAPGQPMSLNAPASVQMLKVGNEIHYLIADSGNNRVLEVKDTLDATGNVTPGSGHVLNWVSHTGDKFGRHYRYGSATYFNVSPSSGLPASIVAAVTNTRLSPLNANGTLGPAGGDAPGGTLIGFDYALGRAPYGSVGTGTVTGVFTSFQVQGVSANTTYQVRNPRYLSIYTPPTPPATGPQFSILYADDNGAFDLTPTAVGFVAGLDNLHFTALDYQAMNTPVGGITGNLVGTTTGTYNRAGLPFVPSCVQRLNSDPKNPKYLITQTYSMPELGSSPNRIGGEVFEVDVTAPSSGPNPGIVTAPGGFGGSTLSRPGLTGPLTQPTSAIRPQQ